MSDSPLAQAIDAAPVVAGGLADDCPVRALGHHEGSYWFSDPLGQVRCKRQFRLGDVLDLFLGQIGWLRTAYPAARKTESWDNTAAAAALIAACVAAGPFDGGAIRGPGIWWESDEEWDGDGRPAPVVLHAGQAVLRLEWAAAGLKASRLPAGARVGDWVYRWWSQAEPLPARQAATAEQVHGLHDFLCSWNWVGGADDAHLIIGAIGVGFVPALLAHRPIILVEGESGCGKSALFSLVQRMHGGGAIRKENATAAFFREQMERERAARLVILNEFEAKAAGNARATEMVEWLRFAYTRGEGGWGRGGRDGSGGEGSDVAALIGAIMAPPVDEQDANRRIVLKLEKLQVDEEDMLTIDERLAQAAALGPALRRRLLEGWPRFRGTYRLYQAALLAGGHSPRGITTWATVLAMADLMRWDDACAIRARQWADKIRAEQLAVDAPVKAPQAVLDRLLSYRIEEYRGSSKHTVLEYLLEGIEAPRPDGIMAVCKRMGITLTDLVHVLPGGAKVTIRYLAVCTAMSGVEDVFRNTLFAGGLWKDQMLKLPGARKPDNPIRFGSHEDSGGGRSREFRSRAAVLVPVRQLGITDGEGLPITGEWEGDRVPEPPPPRPLRREDMELTD